MALQSRTVPFRGPFRGLNTTQEPRELGPQWAIDATNIVLSEGRIRPRAPMRPYASVSGIPVHLPSGADLVGMFQWDPEPASNSQTFLLIKAVRNGAGELYIHRGFGAEQLPAATLSPFPPTFVSTNGFVYVLDGSFRMYKTNGLVTKTIGIDPPFLHPGGTGFGHVDFQGLVTIGAGDGIGATVQYAVTFRDSTTSVESNPLYSQEFVVGSDQGVHILLNPGTNVPWPQQGIDQIRIYRKNVTLGQTGFRLVAQNGPPTPGSNLSFVDNFAEEEITLSSDVSGPFAPSRNGIPPPATVGAIYKDRMFYNDLDNGRVVRYSAFGIPDHVDPVDFETLAGDPLDGVTGMVDDAGQLVIGRPKSIWILSGVVDGATNEIVATGAAIPASSHELYRTKSPVGCANTRGGNGFIVCGNPPMVHFNSDSGFFVFSGADVRMVSDAIRRTWISTVQGSQGFDLLQSVTYADDPHNQILLIHHKRTDEIPGTFAPNEVVLAYHYGARREDGVGAWTVFNFAAPETDGAPLCVASSIGLPRIAGVQPPVHYAPFLMGCADGKVFASHTINDDPVDAQVRAPDFRYESGRMTIIEGTNVHVYLVTFLYNPLGDAIPGSTPLVDFGFRADDDFFPTAFTRSVGGRRGTFHKVAARRTVNSISVTIRKNSQWEFGWSPKLGFVGWELDVEPSGQR